MKKQRPVNLDLNTITFPPTAISSILHRATGVAMFIALVFALWAWSVSLSSPEGFDRVVVIMNGIVGYIITVGTVSLITYHMLAGFRHMFMDMGHWEELESGNLSAKITIGLWLVLTVVEAIVIW
ncbi:succinate dehydrogenase, cytochrome b556 subunit [Alteromonas sp. 5E99-2]|uniref:succinate dehydrogenase, cytochrome b556 subunit n=1 Tax=Alteromonas sp. 5E99-2 TaxID=2817683 RepID=UPI001A97F4D1|nr:succinate dehydrogenase, cytochrome b556 subunit [Alteromonas sp. 5E99-2]